MVFIYGSCQQLIGAGSDAERWNEILEWFSWSIGSISLKRGCGKPTVKLGAT